ncbi:hypothetical protein V8E53_010657 [Lactarius tabidus]
MTKDRYPVAEDCQNGDTSRQSQFEAAAPPSHYLGCVPPWRDASQHTGTHWQELRYEGPRADQITSGYDPRRDTQYSHNVTFPPATADGAPHYYGGGIPGPVAYHQGWPSRNAHGPPLAAGFQPNNVTVGGHGQSQGETSPHGAAPTANGQPFAPTGEIPRSSEFLRTLARDYILDPRTNIGEIRMKPSGYGVMEMTITLRVAGAV